MSEAFGLTTQVPAAQKSFPLKPQDPLKGSWGMSAATTAPPSIVATLATGVALEDLRLFLFSLSLFNPRPPTVYLYCDSTIMQAVRTIKYPGRVLFKCALNEYSSMTRAQMEATPGKHYKSLWFDFMVEKLNLLEWVFNAEGPIANTGGILFCDSDICFLAPLPHIPTTAVVALSPHHIRPADEAKYGRFNGGMVFFRDKFYIDIWRAACQEARFYEQSALEEVAANVEPSALHLFPRTQNYGWWRMWQGEKSYSVLQHEWTMNRNKAEGGSGILLTGTPLGSVHTHFGEHNDPFTGGFNAWVVGWLRRLKVHAPAGKLLGYLEQHHPWLKVIPPPQ